MPDDDKKPEPAPGQGAQEPAKPRRLDFDPFGAPELKPDVTIRKAWYPVKPKDKDDESA